MKKFFIKLIEFYQRLSAGRRHVCMFYPTCSEYGKETISKYGIFKGVYFTTIRILRCHPWQEPQVDKVK